MNPGQQAHLGGQRTDFRQAAAVHAALLVQQHPTHDIFLQLVHTFAEEFFTVWAFFAQLGDYLVGQLVNGLVPHGFIRGQHGLASPLFGKSLHILVHLGGHVDMVKLEFFLADVLFDFLDKSDQLFDFIVGDGNGPQHLIFRKLVGAGLDHHNFFGCAGHSNVEFAFLPLLGIGAHHISAVDIAHVDAADGAAPRNIRNG